ncbi:DNA polymerase-4 [Sulfitobacter marinus]|uniref:DNA-directed DNA polymerase n=2 Tax=Sulfitobacter marinus TaxID=394264 RepID=A0A1I6PZ28_9RHOB|nr:DNA polymerase-4 [Sulfitobacter marinus]
MHPLRTIYIDMNSFFASVEQHEEPALRGKPVGITAMEGDVGCLVAASYEAKDFGVKTTMSIKDAKRLCPHIILRPSRHRLYVRYNQRIAVILDRFAELERVRSVDEFQIALGGTTSLLLPASDLVRTMKRAVKDEIGSNLRFSAGIGSNHLLAKIAGKLEKPDGLQWLSPDNMPDRLADIPLDDLPGIARGVLAKLNFAGVYDIPTLYRLDPKHARAIWGSIEGERYVRLMQGENIPLGQTTRGSYGNSKVLALENRTVKNAYMVSRWLVEKSVARLRRDEYTASQFSLFVSLQRPDGRWSRNIKTHHSQDTAHFLDLNRQLWRMMYDQKHPYLISSMGVHLGNILPLSKRPAEMLLPFEMAKQNKREQLAKTIDTLNRRFGDRTVTYGVNKAHYGFFDRG